MEQIVTTALTQPKTCIIICGPTGSGKTNVAIQIAQHFNTQIVSADSRQCYTELNIGVAKPTPEQLAQVPHYFINTLSITEPFSAAQYEKYALKTVQHIFTQSNVAVVCGGTGLYIKAFCQGLDDMATIPENVRQQIINDYQQHGLAWLQNTVQQEDNLYWQQGETQNPQRLMRALEVVRATGKSITLQQQHIKKVRPFNIIKIAVDIPREILYQQINNRVDEMILLGLEAEAKLLYPQKNLNAMQTVGYTEMFSYLDGDISLNQAVSLIKQHTRHYAKRQVTWFKKEDETIWLPANEMLNAAKKIVT